MNDPILRIAFLAPSATPFLVDDVDDVRVDILRLADLQDELTSVSYDELLPAMPKVAYPFLNFILVLLTILVLAIEKILVL